MPTNLGNAPLDGLKIGQTAVSKSYIGIDQIFPNATEITAAAFDNANVTNTAQNTNYSVAGEIGSSFTLTGATGATGPGGTQILSASPTTYSIAIGGNDSCGDQSRTPQITIAPQGNSTLAGGLSNVDTILQAAGPAYTPNSGVGISISATNTVYNVSNQGGNLYWMYGAAWDITVTYSFGSGGQNAINWMFMNATGSASNWTFTNVSPSNAWSSSTQLQWNPQNPTAGSYTCTATFNAQNQYDASVSFTTTPVDNPTGCWQSGASATTGALYP